MTRRADSADAPLPEGEALFREMANGLPLIVWVHDADGQQVMVNDTFCEFFGVTREQMKGGEWRALMHPDDEDGYTAEFLACLRERRPFHAEVRVRRGDGDWRWLESWGRPRFSASGDFRGMVGTSADVTDRKRSERDLERAYSLIEGITEGSEDRIAAQDLDLRYTYFNEAYRTEFEELWGHRIEIGTRMPDALAPWPDEQRKAEALWRRALTGESFRVEVEFGPSPNEQRVYDLRFNPICDADGTITGAAHIFRDVTERVRVEQALRESEERARAIIASIADGLIAVDARWQITLVNPRAEDIVRPISASGESLLGRDFWEAFPATVGTSLEHSYRRAMRERVPVAFETYFEPLANWFDVRVYPAPDGSLSIYFLDIGERKRAEKALRRSEQRFRDLADNMLQLAWMGDETGSLVWYNRRWYEYTGTTLEEMKGWGWTNVHHPDHVERVVERFQRSLDAGEPWEDLFPLRGRDGDYRWFLSRAQPIRDDNGAITRWFGTNTDVTDQREAEERLREVDRRKDEYLAMLGHELRNPLAALQSATELVKDTGLDDPRLERAAGVLERQTSHMARLIDGLLEVSRIARGKISLERATVDLRDVVAKVLEDHGARSAKRGLALRQELPAEPVWVFADRVRIAQILDNLLGNAIKFTPAQGRVDVVLRAETDRAILEVRDTGVGISAHALTRIFEPFHQEAQDVARGSGGLGLGLALAKGLVELHDGTIEARSDGVGAGTDVRVSLPLAAAPTARAAPRAASETTARRILVVEDNEDAAEMLKELLRLRGHDVAVAATAADALDALRRDPREVVLCDIGLPGMNGYELARAVRADPALRWIRLVAITGYGQPSDERRSADAGFDAHLTKPVQMRALAELLAPDPARDGASA